MQAGEAVLFDASASHDPDGTVSSYEWDFDGDGAFDRTTTGATTSFTYPAAGDRTVVLRVTDAAGATGQVSLVLGVSAPPGPTPPVVPVVPQRPQVPAERVAPVSLSASTTPGRSRRIPFTLRTGGRLTLPAGVLAAEGCMGRVTVVVKAGRQTISRRATALRAHTRCASASGGRRGASSCAPGAGRASSRAGAP